MVLSSETLGEWVQDARRRSLALLSDLDDGQLLGPRLAIVNPLLWEIGHVGWFQERWVLRVGRGRPPLRADGDALYDSSAVPHDTRWDLPLPDRAETLAYLAAVEEQVLTILAQGPVEDELAYYLQLAIFHEDMHGEAFAYTRQTHGWPAPPLSHGPAGPPAPVAAGDAHVPGGAFTLGSAPGEEPFLFDNEKWAHPVEVRPFTIARCATSEGDFAAFVEEGGYRRPELWTEEGWAWRRAAGAELPLYWRRDGRSFSVRRFDRWHPLRPGAALIHVNAYEAEAYCRWAGRRLPSELEWEAAARGVPAGATLGGERRRYPWGADPPDSRRAALDLTGGATCDVRAHPEGDSAFGVRQLLGNTWEWTATPFLPFAGFSADPYQDYSRPWFGDHRVLKGGCFATRARLIRPAYRNFYRPDRRDVWAGFRTCALS